MIEDVVLSIGRVGTLATWGFLRSSSEIVPASWFDAEDVRRHWNTFDAMRQRVVLVIHHSRHVSLLDLVPSERLRVTWNTRCPFASARSSMNYWIFQDIIANGGRPSRPWTELLPAGGDDLNGFYPAVARALRDRNHQIIDFADYAPGSDTGYRRLADFHRLDFASMAVPDGKQFGLFEAFLCGYRFQIGTFSYLIIPAAGVTWQDNDLYLGDVAANEVFPDRYSDARPFSVYVEMGRPDSQWKRQLTWDLFLERRAGLAAEADPLFEASCRAYERTKLAEDDRLLVRMVSQAIGKDLKPLMAAYPEFGRNWQPVPAGCVV